MRKLLGILVLATSATMASSGTAQPPTTTSATIPGPLDAKALVARVDAVRRPALPNVKMAFTLTTTDGDESSSYSYVAYARGDTGSLVLAQDGDQRGQKYLYTPGGYWLYAPRTRRPLRLTPLQTLRGQASIGDVSRLNFGADYDAVVANPSSAQVAGRDCVALALTAKSPAATYATITLYVATGTGLPVEADMMSAAGRKLKSLQFGAPVRVGAQTVITSITYIDGVDTAKRTVEQIQSIEPSDAPAEIFQPAALSIAPDQ
jgi:hypothetical protein